MYAKVQIEGRRISLLHYIYTNRKILHQIPHHIKVSHTQENPVAIITNTFAHTSSAQIYMSSGSLKHNSVQIMAASNASIHQ